MGCGSSNTVVQPEDSAENGGVIKNGYKGNEHKLNGVQKPEDEDDIPTVLLPESPRKPPLAFEIPVDNLADNKEKAPPPRIQKLMEKPPPEISLPDIEEKLAEAEHRRQMILQQRAASASKRVQKAMKAFSVMDSVDNTKEYITKAANRFSSNTLQVPQDKTVIEDRNI